MNTSAIILVVLLLAVGLGAAGVWLLAGVAWTLIFLALAAAAAAALIARGS